ncbi:MAG: 16S rRNA (cytidine(1402)-2'-O)-methyltransferase [Acidaminococcaceae bacterium]|jgi:16S rRNA (cytidine1402-2'-O)-methyltransferase|nr:16S rRNA (cytidine(1402)-2'-O)-methyltransferase [Acidaminococcaceae bacterium]
MVEGKGTLYLCATPIGNLSDMTPRAVEMLKAADLIAAEDTRHTRQLLTHFDIHGPMISYHEHNKERQGPILIEKMLNGTNIALVSDAGFPGIADPGEALAKEAIAAGITVVPVPGANAALTGLIGSGLPCSPFFFGGFLPKSKKNRREKLAEWKHITCTIVLYEAPHRIVDVLKDILNAWGDRPMVLARELTKIHEEFFRGTVTTALNFLAENPPRGEFVVVMGGSTDIQEPEKLMDPLEKVRMLMAQGTDKKSALGAVAKEYKIPKRELYNRLLKEEGEVK